MLPYWIEEGERQTRLGLLWQRYMHLLETQQTESPCHGPWHRVLRERVLEPFVRSEWVPGVRDILEVAKNCWRNGRSFPDWPGADVFGRFAEVIRDSTDDASSDRLTIDGRDDLRCLLRACAGSVCEPTAEQVRFPALNKGRYFCPAAAAVRMWLEQAQALAAWRELQPELDAHLHDRQVRDGIRDCAEQLAEFGVVLTAHRRIALRRRWLVPPSASLLAILDASERIAANSRAAFEGLLSDHEQPVGGDWHRECGVWQRKLADDLQRAPASWPPLWLAKMQEEFAKLHPDRLPHMLADLDVRLAAARLDSTSVSLAEFNARRALLRLLTERLDELENQAPLEREVWSRLEAQTPLLCDSPGWQVQLIRTPDSDFATVEKVLGDRPLRIRTTGIVVIRLDGKVEPHHDRQAVIEVPQPVPRLVQPLRQLARRVETSDSTLAQMCRDLARGLEQHPSLRDWYESAAESHSHETLLWRLMQRIAAWEGGTGNDDQGDAVALVLEAAREEGVTLEPLPLEQSDGPRDAGPWVVWAGPATVDTRASSGPVAVRPTLRRSAVRMPDGTLVAPSFCLTVPGRFLPERPLINVLVDREAELAGLRIRDPEWCGWQTCNDQIFQLASVGTSSPEDDAQHGLRLFEALFTRACEPSTWQSMYRGLALAFYRCLTDDLGAEITPAVQPATGKFQPISSAKIKAGQWRWEANSAERCTPIRVERFGFRCGKVEQSARGSLSLGEDAPRELVAWLQLPAPTFLGHGWAGGEEHPLAAWWSAVQELPCQPHAAAQAIARARESFHQVWVQGAVGREWLNEFLHMVLETRDHETDPAARLWYAQLTSPGTAWFDCYPRLDAETGHVEWPPGTTTAGSGLRWKFDDKVPRGRTLEPEIRFAPDPESAAGHFSLGRREDAVFLAALEPLQQIAARLHPTHGDLNRRVSDLVTDVREREFGVPVSGQPDTMDQRLLELLDAVTSVAVPRDEDRDPVLMALTAFCRIAKYRILPSGWSFVAGECVASEVANHHDSPDFDTVAEPQFHDAVCRGRWYVTKLGLRQRERLIRSPEVFRSVGPEPLGYLSFTGWLQDFEKQVRDSWPAAEAMIVAELIRALQLWPRKSLEDVLVDGIVTFHANYWDKLAAFAKREAPEFHEEFRARLQNILTSQELKLLEPVSVSRYPEDWIEVEYRSGRRWGEITQVLRPGIVDARNDLCLRARVVVGE